VPSTTRKIALAFLAVAALAGCSSATGAAPATSSIRDAAAPEVLTQASANARTQSTVHLRGNGQCPESAFYVDMRLRRDGGATGSVRFGASTVQVVSSGGSIYVQGPSSFWTAQDSPAAATQIGTKWVRLSPGSNACLAALTTFSTVLDNYLGYPGTPVKGQAQAVFGVPAVMLSLPGNVTIWVGAKGVPVPVRIDDPATKTGISLGEWGQKVDVTAPTATDVIDASAVKK